ncbi:MAG: AAA domain-containing protein [Chitinivibrionales bacterium]|nr:AAA domain-containing protein [Chitinivibrionales bacterium]
MPRSQDDVALLDQLHSAIEAIKSELSKKIVGQQAVIDDLLACLFARGHCLLIGVPGLAKTMLVQSLAQCLDCDFNRIQFTPDLMPSDITGSEILYEDKSSGMRDFRFVTGPLFANIILADEINRTPPKTQSALLQAMQEYEVTSSGTTHPLPHPFWVLATQNPIEQEGTYPLPEAQQDRFMFSIEIDYPGQAEEVEIVKRTTSPCEAEIQPRIPSSDIDRFHALITRIPVADSVIEFAVKLVRATRPTEQSCPGRLREMLTWGAGPRASQYLITAAKAYAVVEGRPTPDIEDVKRAAPPVLQHRLVRSFHAESEGVSARDLVGRLLESAG